jgi:hypothetical protein
VDDHARTLHSLSVNGAVLVSERATAGIPLPITSRWAVLHAPFHPQTRRGRWLLHGHRPETVRLRQAQRPKRSGRRRGELRFVLPVVCWGASLDSVLDTRLGRDMYCYASTGMSGARGGPATP